MNKITEKTSWDDSEETNSSPLKNGPLEMILSIGDFQGRTISFLGFLRRVMNGIFTISNQVVHNSCQSTVASLLVCGDFLQHHCFRLISTLQIESCFAKVTSQKVYTLSPIHPLSYIPKAHKTFQTMWMNLPNKRPKGVYRKCLKTLLDPENLPKRALSM